MLHTHKVPIILITNNIDNERILTLSRHQSGKKYGNTSVYQQIELQSHSR